MLSEICCSHDGEYEDYDLREWLECVSTIKFGPSSQGTALDYHVSSVLVPNLMLFTVMTYTRIVRLKTAETCVLKIST
jgi:hypothetical protein